MNWQKIKMQFALLTNWVIFEQVASFTNKTVICEKINGEIFLIVFFARSVNDTFPVLTFFIGLTIICLTFDAFI